MRHLRLLRFSAATTLVLAFVHWLWLAAPAEAVIVRTQEPPDTTLIRARHALRDVDERAWQAIAFKRVRTEGEDRVLLRLVGFPDVVAFDRDRPLLVDLDPVQSVPLPQDMGRLAADAPTLPNVGQFDITDLATYLPRDRALRITLPLVSGADVLLKIPPYMQREWLSVVDFHLSSGGGQALWLESAAAQN